MKIALTALAAALSLLAAAPSLLAAGEYSNRRAPGFSLTDSHFRQHDPQDYRGKTLMLILPDHGRELERPGGAGFLHHSDFYTNVGADEGCRRAWMLAVGPGVAAGRTIERPTPITAAAATGLEYLGLRASAGAAAGIRLGD